MHPESQLQIWDLWYPQAAATGIPFARGRLDATNFLLVHALPPMLTVEMPIYASGRAGNFASCRTRARA